MCKAQAQVTAFADLHVGEQKEYRDGFTLHHYLFSIDVACWRKAEL